MYERKFIFLEEIDKSFAQDIRFSTKGHIKIEQKNKLNTINLFVENIKKGEYVLDILMNNGNKLNIGWFEVSKKNNIVQSFKTNITELIGAKAIIIYPMENFNKKIAMVGWMEDKINKNDLKKLAFKNIEENQPFNKKKEINTNEKENKISIKNKIIDNKKEQEMEIEKNKKKEEIKEETKVEKKIIMNTKKNENVNNDSQNTEKLYKQIKPQVQYLWENMGILDDLFEPIEPFSQNINNHKWWKIDGFNQKLQKYCILYNGYMMPMLYPYMNYKNVGKTYMEKYNYWIFGAVYMPIKDYEKLKYFVYGIPGRFYTQEQPFRGNTGYLYWQSIDQHIEEKMGYWLLYIDVQTGKIVIPKRPTKPPLKKL